MKDEENANQVLRFTATLCEAQSADMAVVLLMALFILHLDTKTPTATTNDFISIVTDGIRELDSAIIKPN